MSKKKAKAQEKLRGEDRVIDSSSEAMYKSKMEYVSVLLELLRVAKQNDYRDVSMVCAIILLLDVWVITPYSITLAFVVNLYVACLCDHHYYDLHDE